ncbi:MAG: hypothetical protein L6R41_004006 [Letrouitia leprolyta]|nr:MAG: hypothetical protein L6R41_004006 [Letrouitia leprolyta]
MATNKFVQDDSFFYKDQLKPRNIRLLKLLPAGSRSDDIYCTIDHACLDDDRIQYEALSYTWGDATQRSNLNCNGKYLSITSNLGQALRYLRSSKETRTLWIDAVCINQADNEEKSHQIAMMRDIYTKAHQVIAWIGEEDPADASAMEVGDPDPLPDNSSLTEQATKAMGLYAKLSSSLISARTLIQRPWFGRAWIIQEAALAERLHIQCGEKVLDWESLYSNLRLMTQTPDASGMPMAFGNMSYQRLEFVEATRKDVKLARSGGEKLDTSTNKEGGSDSRLPWRQLHSAVNNGRFYGASDPRDHVYALLGLVGQGIAMDLHVDYLQSRTAIYRAFVRHVIQNTRTLTALGQLDSSASSDLESWVPDYARAPMIEPLCSDNRPFYAASGDSEARLVESNGPSILALSGIFIDTIEETAPGPNTDKGKVFTRAEQMVHKQVEKVHPTEIVPKLAEKAAVHFFPQSKEIFDGMRKVNSDVFRGNEERADLAGVDGPDRFSKRMLDGMTLFSLGEEEKIKEAITKRGMIDGISSYVRDLRSVRQDYLFGPMHPTASVYMKPTLEEQWQRLAQKCHPYPTGEDIEDVYWRTLIGNRRSNATGTLENPPALWKGAFQVWHEQLWEKEGMVPRFLHGRGLHLKEGLSSWGGMLTTKGKAVQPPLPEDLHRYVEDVVAKKTKEAVDDQHKSVSMRDIVHLIYSVFRTLENQDEKKGPKNGESGKEIVTSKSAKVDASSDGNDSYNSNPEEASSRKTLSPEKVREHLNRAFKYDFLRIARNRKFGTTKRGYIGWCPEGTKKGDRICLLFGGQAPFVVRNVGKEKWRLLGEVYVHGLMDGEGLAMEGVKMDTVRLV